VVLSDVRIDGPSCRPGLVTVEAVCGRLAAFRYACSQTPFDVIQLFVDASPDGQMLYFESGPCLSQHCALCGLCHADVVCPRTDGCTADPVNVASLFHEEVRNAFTVILVGKHAKVIGTVFSAQLWWFHVSLLQCFPPC
jgi:hypothetical protein